jgi:hypothetical protein
VLRWGGGGGSKKRMVESKTKASHQMREF